MLSLTKFRAMVSRALDRIPAALTEELEGGVLVLEELRRSMGGRDAIPGVYLLGEYVDDPYGLGRRIVLYYGSFRAMMGGAPDEEVYEEIERTLAHELRHHVESLAGRSDLDEEDLRELRRLREQAKGAGNVRRPSRRGHSRGVTGRDVPPG